MKILMTGANGMLADAVKNKFKEHELILTDANELDITKLEEVEKFVREINPSYIINCAAYTAVDKAEENEEICEKVNARGPENLAKAAKKIGAILVHISTDYVFSGDLDLEKTYLEDDKTAPVTVYGKTKLLGEELIKENIEEYYIFRTAWLYGQGNNFVRTMLKLGEIKDELNVVCDQHGSPTSTEDLANIIKQVVDKKMPYGVYHSTNQEYTNWCDFTKTIFEYAKIECKVNPVTTEEYIKMMNIVQAKRPTNSKLSKEKLLKNGVEIPTWKEALKKYLEVEGKIK